MINITRNCKGININKYKQLLRKTDNYDHTNLPNANDNIIGKAALVPKIVLVAKAFNDL